MSDTPNRPRTLAAGLASVLPAVVALWSWITWTGELPAAIGTHWSSSGPADRATPTCEFFTATFCVTAVASVVGATVAVLPRCPARARRLILLGSGSVSAIAASQWLVSTGLTLHAGDPYKAVLGSWILVIFGSCAYGVLPLLLAPPVHAASPAPAPGRSAHNSP